MLGVNGDERREDLLSPERSDAFPWRCWWDGGSPQRTIAQAWSVEPWPAVFLLDHRGVIRYRQRDWDDWDSLERAIDQLLAETPANAAPLAAAIGG